MKWSELPDKVRKQVEEQDWRERQSSLKQEIDRCLHGTMNKTEAAYSEILDAQIREGTFMSYQFEAINLRLGQDLHYRPDFMVVTPTLHIQFHEVKGFWRDDARVKIKAAAEKFRAFRFVAIRKLSKKEARDAGGAWAYEEFSQ